MSQKYNDYLKTDYWKAVSDAVKKRDGYRCRICNSQHDLSAHHRTYDHRGREMDFLDDLTTLCRRCHSVFHGTLHIPPQTPVPQQPTVPNKMSKKERKALRTKERDGMTNIRPHTQEEVDAEMPDGEEIILSRELLARCRTNGAFTTATISALGIAPHMSHGWVDRLAGTMISRDRFRQAIEGKYVYAKPCFPIVANGSSL